MRLLQEMLQEPESERRTRKKTLSPVGKVMVTVFWDYQEIVFDLYFKIGISYYAQLLKCLKPSCNKKVHDWPTKRYTPLELW